MTPRQAAIRDYFEQREKALERAQLLRVINLAFGGDQQSVTEWLDDQGLDLE